jgi:hypothetical protein
VAAYRRILLGIRQSGAGYPVDQLLRQLAIEYTHRYASAGVGSQPVSFNYFEAFCDIKLIENSVAPMRSLYLNSIIYLASSIISIM